MTFHVLNFTTGGCMYALWTGAATILLLIPLLCLILPLSAGQQWIGTGMALSISFVLVFVWSWIDPTKRSINIPRLTTIFLLMLSGTNQTVASGWQLLLTSIYIYLAIIGASLLLLIFTEPLALLMPKNLSVFLYNAGVLLEAATQPIQAHARSEALPHFEVEHPMASLTAIRTSQMNHMDYILHLMRENTYEESFEPDAAEWNKKLLHSLVVVNDVILSITSFSARGIAYNLNAAQWKILAPQVDKYIGYCRDYISSLNTAMLGMYSGSSKVHSFDNIKQLTNNAREQLLSAYTHDLKHDGHLVAGKTISASSNLDHYIYQISQLLAALNHLSTVVDQANIATSKFYHRWLIQYHLKALGMPFLLVIFNGIYLIRSSLKLILLPLQGLYRKCINRKSDSASTSQSDSNNPAPISDQASQLSNAPSKISSNPSALKNDSPVPKKKTAVLTEDAESHGRAEDSNLIHSSGDANLPSREELTKEDIPSSAYQYEKKKHRLLTKSLKATAPPNILWEEYYRDGRWKWLIRYICVVTPVTLLSIALILHWTPKVNFPWAIPSCIIVMGPTVGGTWRRFLHRAIGSFVGALAGQVSAIICEASHRFVCFAPLIIVTFICSYLAGSRHGKYSYFYLVTLLTFCIVLLSAWPFQTGFSWRVGSFRFLFVLIGSFLGSLASFIFPEMSYDRFLNVVRALVDRSHKTITHIHESLAAHQAADFGLLSKLEVDMNVLNSTTVALRYEAAAEKFYDKSHNSAIRFLYYKARDMCYAVRLQIFSVKTGFFGSVDDHANEFIDDANLVKECITTEASYVEAHLNRKCPSPSLSLTTDEFRRAYLGLEDKTREIKSHVSPKQCLQISSHMTIFRLYCVLLNDITRATEYYY